MTSVSPYFSAIADHPNLLEASFEKIEPPYISKPILAREGANMELVRSNEQVIATGGSYGDQPKVYQRAVELPVFDGQHVVIGSWMVGTEPAGMIMRESESPIVVNTSRVLPHYFVP